MAERDGAGAPLGNSNSARGKEYTRALKRSLARLSGKDYEAGLELVTKKLAELAIDGEIAAILEIGNRFEGKPMQATTISGDPENPLVVTEVVRKII